MNVRFACVAFAAIAVAAVSSQSSADAQKVPFDAELAKPLGFRTKPGLDNAIPFVFEKKNYLQPGAQVRVTSVAVGSLFVTGAFCAAEVDGKTGYIRCDDAASMRITPPGTWPSSNSYGASCAQGGDHMASCKKFCTSVCDVPGGDAKHTTCPRLVGGAGMIDKTSALLKPVPKLKHVTMRGDSCEKGVCRTMNTACASDSDCFVRATQEVIDGLQKLDTVLDASEYAGHSMMLTSCWRDGVFESKQECYYIMNGDNPVTEKLMAWPGANPHSSGHGCDIYLQKNGKQIVEHGGHDAAKNVCKNQEGSKAASRLQDEILTKSGATRLDYEPWHFEWGSTGGCRCKAPDCNDKFWPPACSPSQCP